jgi:probable phosphoglycerate mutase
VAIVRHGATEYNKEGGKELLRGWLDLPLDARGIKEAKQTAQAMSRVPISRILTSDLIRAVDTAQAIRQSNQAPLAKTPLLRPWNLPTLEGTPAEEHLPQIYNWERNPDQIPPGKGAESFNQFLHRLLDRVVFPAMKEAQAHPERGVIVLSTHSSVIGMLRAWLATGVDNYTYDPRELIPRKLDTPGAIVYLYFTGKEWELSDGGEQQTGPS